MQIMLRIRFFLIFCLGLTAVSPIAAQDDCSENVEARVHVDPGHPWRPPFGLDRVGQPLTALVEVTSEKGLAREYSLVGYLRGKEVGRYALTEINHQRRDRTGYFERVTFDAYPDELALFAQCRFQGKLVELTREKIQPPMFEAEPRPHPPQFLNTADLGMVLFPAHWVHLPPCPQPLFRLADTSR